MAATIIAMPNVPSPIVYSSVPACDTRSTSRGLRFSALSLSRSSASIMQNQPGTPTLFHRLGNSPGGPRQATRPGHLRILHSVDTTRTLPDFDGVDAAD